MSTTLNFDDTLGVTEAIGTAGAPRAAAFYPRLSRLRAALLAEAHSVQEERLDFSERAAIGRADLLRRLAGTKDKAFATEIEQQISADDARTSRRLAEYAERSAAASAKLETDGRCVDNVHQFLNETVGRGLLLRDVPLPTRNSTPRGLATAIEAKRAALVANAERRADIERRPALPDDLKAAIGHTVAKRAAKGRPPFDPRIRGGADPSKLDLMLQLGGPPGGQLIGDGGTDFLVWLLADQIEARLHALVDEADLAGAMSDAERIAALAALDAERLALEREEEAIIRMAEAQGMTVARRADADPRSVLMVEVRK